MALWWNAPRPYLVRAGLVQALGGGKMECSVTGCVTPAPRGIRRTPGWGAVLLRVFCSGTELLTVFFGLQFKYFSTELGDSRASWRHFQSSSHTRLAHNATANPFPLPEQSPSLPTFAFCSTKPAIIWGNIWKRKCTRSLFSCELLDIFLGDLQQWPWKCVKKSSL